MVENAASGARSNDYYSLGNTDIGPMYTMGFCMGFCSGKCLFCVFTVSTGFCLFADFRASLPT